jgi:hypothetical protein
VDHQRALPSPLRAVVGDPPTRRGQVLRVSLEAGTRLAGWSWFIGGVAAILWLSSWLPAGYHLLNYVSTGGESGMLPSDLVLLREARPWLVAIGLGLLAIASVLTVMLTVALYHIRRSRPVLSPPADWPEPERLTVVDNRETMASSLALAVVGGLFAVPDPIWIPFLAVSGAIAGGVLAMAGGWAREVYACMLYGRTEPATEPAIAAEHPTDIDVNAPN